MVAELGRCFPALWPLRSLCCAGGWCCGWGPNVSPVHTPAAGVLRLVGNTRFSYIWCIFLTISTIVRVVKVVFVSMLVYSQEKKKKFLLSARAATSRAESREGNRGCSSEALLKCRLLSSVASRTFWRNKTFWSPPVKAVIWDKAELRGSRAVLGNEKGKLAALMCCLSNPTCNGNSGLERRLVVKC